MKKRFIATLLVGAIGVAGIAGLTACDTNSVSMPKGEQVSAEKWAEAFTLAGYKDLKNYTYSESKTASISVKGSETSEGKTHKSSGSAKYTSYKTTLYEGDGGFAYSEKTSNTSATLTSDGETYNSSKRYSDKKYYQPKSNEDGTKTYYSASYNLDETKSNVSHTATETYWHATSTQSFIQGEATPNHFLADSFQTQKDSNTVVTLDKLYESFGFAGGVYTAKLYLTPTSYDYDLDELGYLLSNTVECEVAVSIKDGIVVGYSVKAETKESISENGVNVKYTVSFETVIALTDIDSTKASKKESGDIKKAIDKYIEAEKTATN